MGCDIDVPERKERECLYCGAKTTLGHEWRDCIRALRQRIEWVNAGFTNTEERPK